MDTVEDFETIDRVVGIVPQAWIDYGVLSDDGDDQGQVRVVREVWKGSVMYALIVGGHDPEQTLDAEEVNWCGRIDFDRSGWEALRDACTVALERMAADGE